MVWLDKTNSATATQSFVGFVVGSALLWVHKEGILKSSNCKRQAHALNFGDGDDGLLCLLLLFSSKTLSCDQDPGASPFC